MRRCEAWGPHALFLRPVDECESNPVRRMKRWILIVGCILVFLFAALLLIPLFSPVSRRGTNSVSMAGGKQVCHALHLYAADHNKQFPATLYELTPDYLPEYLPAYGVRDPAPKVERRYEWLYFPPRNPGNPSDITILSAAPFPIIFGSFRTLRRLVIFSDCTATNLLEADFRSRIVGESRRH